MCTEERRHTYTQVVTSRDFQALFLMFKMHVRFVLVVDCALENVDDSFGPMSHHFTGPLAGRAHVGGSDLAWCTHRRYAYHLTYRQRKFAVKGAF